MIDFIKDADCTKETPVRLGVPDAPIYGKGIKLKPRVDGRTDSEHFKKIYLPELLPLEEYDLIVVLISGGKDSVACYLKLLELGIPKERIEFWHHDIDGGHPSRRMDWKCTQNYVKALADAEGIKLRVSYRVNGFFGELYRMGEWKPTVVIWENVKNVLSKHMIHNFNRYLSYMEKLGYSNNYKVLDCRDYGIPQARERCFTVSILGDNAFDFELMEKRPMKNISNFLEYGDVPDCYLVTQPSVYSVIGKKGIRRATIIKDYVNTITTRQDRTPAQVIDLGGGKYRYLTELECWRLMGYSDDDFYAAEATCRVEPGKMNRTLYHQAGNSIPVQ